MNGEEAAEQLDATRASLDDTAKHISTLFITFLLASVYVAIAVGSTNDEQLLRESDLPLPLLGVGLPIKSFYTVVPVASVLMHLHLLLYIYFLSRKAADFESLLQRVAATTQVQEKRLAFPLLISPVTFHPV